LEEYYKNSDSIFAKLSVKEGYYYLGVKNNIYINEFYNIYSLKFRDLGDDDIILAKLWYLKDNQIAKIYQKEK
jgi:hypothetical protein